MKKIILFLLSVNLFSCDPVLAQEVKTILIIFENQPNVIGNPLCPTFTMLANMGAQFDQYFAINNPSQGNYIALFCGSNLGVHDDGDKIGKFNQANMVTQLQTVNKKCEIYSEGQPSIGSKVLSSGLYAQKHNPFPDFTNVSPSLWSPATLFNINNLADVTWFIPNLINDMHDGSSNTVRLQNGEKWLSTNAIAQSIIHAAGDSSKHIRLIITFDEGNTSNNRVSCIFYGYGVRAGAHISLSYNHFSLFKTITSWYGGNGEINEATGKPVMINWEASPVVVTPPIDTVKKCYNLVTTVTNSMHIDTSYTTSTKVDSVFHACDSIVPPPVTDTSFYAGFYEQHYDQDAANKSLADVLIRDINAKGFNTMHCYGTGSGDPVKMRALNARIKSECPKMRKIIDVTSGSLPINGFDGVNFEIEDWNASNPDASWSSTKQKLISVHAAMIAAGMVNYQYFGWWLSTQMKADCPITLSNNTSAVILHDYRSGPDFAYTKGRCDDIDKVATHDVFIIVLPSAEPSFSQNYFKTHTLLDFYNTWSVGFDAQHYKHLKRIGYLVFTRSFLDVAQAVPAATFAGKILRPVVNLFRSQAREIKSPGFINQTVPEHLKYIEQ